LMMLAWFLKASAKVMDIF